MVCQIAKYENTYPHTLKYKTSHILVYFSQERFSCLKFKFMFCKISWGTMNAVQTKLLLLRSTFILGNKSKDFYFVSMWSGVRIEQKHPLSFAEEDIECRFWQKMSMSPAGRRSLQFCNDFINWGEKACKFDMTLSTGEKKLANLI